MPNLTAAQRRRMPPKEFALPGKRFPLNDAAHQRAAISGAARAERVGNINADTAAEIKAKARAKLGRSGDGVGSGFRSGAEGREVTRTGGGIANERSMEHMHDGHSMKRY